MQPSVEKRRVKEVASLEKLSELGEKNIRTPVNEEGSDAESDSNKNKEEINVDSESKNSQKDTQM